MDAPIDQLVSSALLQFQKLTRKPEVFLGVQNAAAEKFQETTKEVYDFLKDTEDGNSEALPELIVENFDDEQIWQELELQNDPAIKGLLADVAHILTGKESVSFRLRQGPKVPEKSKKTLKARKAKLTSSSDTGNGLTDGKEKDKTIESESENKDEISETESLVDDATGDGAEESDTEINKIKNRLKCTGPLDTSAHDSDSDELDFDFGELGGKNDASDDDSDENVEDLNRESDDDEYISREKRTKTVKSRTGNKAGYDQASCVDDQFFKLSQMETFLEQEDRKAEDERRREEEDEEDQSEEDEEDVDMFEELLSSDEEHLKTRPSRKMKYKDFFAPVEGQAAGTDEDNVSGEETDDEGEADIDGADDIPAQKKVRFQTPDSVDSNDEGQMETDQTDVKADVKAEGKRPLLADSDSEGEDVADILGGKTGEDKSNFEKRQERLAKRISEMENASLAEKPWQLSGEITSVQRPENSLIEEFLQFDQTTKLPPVITDETTKSIEDVIRQRIKDQAWDDVERKVKPKEDPFEYKKRVVLDQEKSKLSLGEIYEQEYLKQQKKDEEEETDPDHEDIKKEMRDLFIKLDALSNFHFTPKPPAPDIRIVSNLPSISMEEVAPVSVSDDKLLAPQEIKEKTRGEVKGPTEKTETDHKRERREKKAAKRARQKAKEQREKLVEKLKPGLGNKYSKEKALKELERSSKQDKAIKIIKDKGKNPSSSSKTFFTQLQDEVVSQISKKKAEKKSKTKFSEKSSKKFKL